MMFNINENLFGFQRIQKEKAVTISASAEIGY